MSRTIYKYDLGITGLDLHLADPKVLHVGDQGGVGTVWIEHGFDVAPDTNLSLHIVGTGHIVPEGASHVGTFLQGPFVWHVYEQREQL